MTTPKPEILTLSVQVPAPTVEALQERAKVAERSVSAEVRLALRAYLAEPTEAAA